nr:hypothetical protein [Treponema sp. OMZ 790]
MKFPPKSDTSDLPVLTDIMGVRIICPFLQDINEVETILLKKFKVIEVERKGSERTLENSDMNLFIFARNTRGFKVGLVLPKI